MLHMQDAFCYNFLMLSAKQQSEIFIFEVLTTTQTRSSKSFILCLYVKIICAKQAKVHFACFVRHDQRGIIRKLSLTLM